MKPRYRLKVVHDEQPTSATAVTADAVAPVSDTSRFHVLIIVEGVLTTDGREFHNLSWRDLPLPFMAQDWTDVEHMKALLIGNIDTIEKQGDEVHGWGSYVEAEPGSETARLIGLVQRGELRGVSADIEVIEAEVLLPVEAEADGETEGDVLDPFDDPADSLPRETDDDGQEWIVLGGPNPRLRVNEGRIMGATALPFPAFPEAFVENETALVADAGLLLARHGMSGVVFSLTADGAQVFDFPALPPADWFAEPEHDGPTALTITNDGQVYGHLAVWGECHIGFAGECVEPPQSATDYARFHLGEVPCADGSRVAAGKLTFSTGHAPLHLDLARARSHYDDTGTVAADVVAHDGVHGIWIAGAMRQGLSIKQVREVMAAPPSGDWRLFAGNLELVAALSVNVPGYNVPRVSYRKAEGLVASLVVSHPAAATRGAPSTNNDDDLADRLIERIAASIGRSAAQRRAALHARVHGEG